MIKSAAHPISVGAILFLLTGLFALLEVNMTDKNNHNDIRYEHIKVRELVSFAEKVIQGARPGQFVPITLQRARAHAHNPYADPEDVALLAAIDSENEVVGYFGILPIMLRIRDQLHKCHWFTTWSVSGKVRGRGVGSELMREALNLQKDFLIVGSIHARRVCRKYGFWERAPLDYYWIEPSGMGTLNPLALLLRLLRKTAHLLRLKKEIRTITPAVRAVARLFSPFTRRLFYPLLSHRLARTLQETRFQQVPELRQGLTPGLFRPDVELHRGVEAINWMLAYPWVVKTGTSPTETMDYYFSDTRPRHEFIAMELLDNKSGAYNGFVVFSLSQKGRDVVIKTLDYAIQDAQQFQQILALAVHLGREHNAAIIEIPKEAAQMLAGSWLGRLLLQKKQRIYQCHPNSNDSPLAGAWKDLTLHLYDGDMAFS
jgi:hypothetical protein